MAKRKLSKTTKKITYLSFIYLFLIVSFLSPFIAIEGANKVLGFIIAGIITLIYLLVLIIFLWDWLKQKNQ